MTTAVDYLSLPISPLVLGISSLFLSWIEVMRINVLRLMLNGR